VIEEIEQKEKAIEQKLSSVESVLWKLFSELMDEDCLNADRPEMFLAIKNVLKLSIIDGGEPFTKLLQESFAELDNSKQPPLQPTTQPPLPDLPRTQSSSNLLPRKRTALESKSIQSQLLASRETRLRNDILQKIESEALPCNRLQYDLNEDEVNDLMVSFFFVCFIRVIAAKKRCVGRSL
jgi:hypothetical protein